MKVWKVWKGFLGIACFNRSFLLTRKQALLYTVGVSLLSTYWVLHMLSHDVKSTAEVLEEEMGKWDEQICAVFDRQQSERRSDIDDEKKFLITWYKVSPYIKYRPEVLDLSFKPCKYNNCELSLCKETVERSDAVLFNGRRLPKYYELKRPIGQIWIFAEEESPYTYDKDKGHFRSEFWRSAFNWTMTYDGNMTDIYLPYGGIWKKKARESRDFRAIAKNKTRDALFVSSHCFTKSKREKYVEELQKYIEVDIIGECGRPWECGLKYIHDDCFKILSTTYKFFLAFENALCRGYHTEKFFENFNYDVVLVARGGISEEDKIEPKDVYISTSDFPNVESLGRHLKKLSDNVDEYANLLERKNQYYSPDFHETYQTALCNICEKMNAQEKYHREIKDLQVEHAHMLDFCTDPTDVKVQEEGFFKMLFGTGGK